MNATQKKFGPFAVKGTGWLSPYSVIHEVADRLRLVRESTDAEWLQAVLKHRDTEMNVRVAAEQRLKWVIKAVKALRRQARSAV